MNRLAVLTLIACLLIGVTYVVPVNPTIAKDVHTGELLTKTFEASGATAEGYYVHNWSVVDSQFQTPDTLAQMAGNMNTLLQIPDARKYTQSDSQHNVYELQGRWDPSTSVSLILTSMNLQNKPQTSLVIKIERVSQNVQDITQSIEKIKNVVASIGVRPQISTCIKGIRDDRIEQITQDTLVGRMFSQVDAAKVEGLYSDSLTSVSGYSPLTREFITTNGKRMNLQTVVQWDNYQQKTRILVGSPIITIEY